MRRLLLVSYVFPPAGGITVQRALSFAKYLPRHAIEVHVLTARNAAAPVQDPGLLEHVPSQVRIHRCLTAEPPFALRKKIWALVGGSNKSPRAGQAAAAPAQGGLSVSRLVKRILTPDPQVLWAPFAIRRAAAVIRRHSIDTVMVTAPPFSVFLIGNALKRRFPQVRLISDFRDEWLRFYLTDFDFLNDAGTRRRAEQIERETIERSDLVLAVTHSSLNEIRSRYPEQPSSKFVMLPNGFDPETFQSFTPRAHGTGRMVVTHMGTAYRTASPRYYLDALDTLPEQIRDSIETRFIGRIAETETGLLDHRLSKVRLLGFVPQAEAVRLAEETDYLLLTMTNDFSLPGKLFEYLAMGKPVLALSPPGGEVDRLLRETGAGLSVSHEDPAAIRALLEQAWLYWRNGARLTEHNRDAIGRYERPRLAERLAELLR